MFDKEQIILWMNSFKNGDINDVVYKQAIIDYFVNAVYVYDDHIKVFYNLEKESETITFAEIEAAFSGSDINGFAPPFRINPVAVEVAGFFLFIWYYQCVHGFLWMLLFSLQPKVFG